MSQKTNLNVSPYYDDFDANQNFYRVLFKPGFPVQSRELTTLQSILQNQVKSFGDHVFKDGSIVIPGNVTYNSEYNAIKINPTHVGLSVGLYLKELIGKKIKGQTSQITAVVQNVLTDVESDSSDYTLYVKYTSADANFKSGQFVDGETLILQENLTYGLSTINSGNTFASLINLNATSTASAVSISEGVYYIRGHFINVSDDTVILDQYTNTPSYRIGLFVDESTIDAQSDNTLYDNARGFSNYAAPGADRLKITATLTKKRLTDLDDKNFVEILRVIKGVVKKVQDTDNYALIKDYIAQRTYEESGDYSVDQFNIEVDESLNNRINSNGIFFANQRTDQGNVPSENLLAIKVSPGKAYIKGFDVEKPVTSILDVEKPRDTSNVENSSVPFRMGNLIRVNNVHGSPKIALDGNTEKVRLCRNRKTTTIHSTQLEEIGKARIYSYNKSDSSNNSSGIFAANNWDLYLWDIQTYTVLTLNAEFNTTTFPFGSYIKGLSSGATAYRDNSNAMDSSVASGSNRYVVSQTSGSFAIGEQISINGSTDKSVSIKEIQEFTIDDIKSIYQGGGSGTTSGLATSFWSDTVLTPAKTRYAINNEIFVNHAGIATITGENFVGIRSDSIIQVSRGSSKWPTYWRLNGVDETGQLGTLTAVPTVASYVNGALPSANTSFNGNFEIVTPKVLNENNKELYAPLNAKNISEVDLSESDLRVVKQVLGESTDAVGTLSVNITATGVSGSFEPFAPKRYSVWKDSSYLAVDSDNFILGANGQSITITGLPASQSDLVVNTTVKKSKITSRQKIYTRSSKLTVDKTVSGINTITTNPDTGLIVSSGLSTNSFNGLRVEDKEISLNVPDAVNIVAVYESVNTATVTLDKLTFGGGLALDTASILGEHIVGSTSGAVAQIVTRSSSTEVEFVYLNTNTFIIGETVRFQESNIASSLVSVSPGDYIDRTSDYVLDKGHKEQYYDYSRIVRKSNTELPIRKLLVIFDYYNVPDSDKGDVYTVESYDKERYKSDIPVLPSGIRASDTLDFRPRVSNFSGTTSSPFDFASRSFTSTNTPSIVLSPNETSDIGYSYYLPRIDKVVLNKDAKLSIIKGASSDSPKPPSSIEEGMELARIELPPYLYNTNDIKISLVDNKRYTMRDIGDLEERIENIEELTSLSLLELDTKSLQFTDKDGISKFKSGFFVDNFKNTDFIDTENPDSKVCVDKNLEELKSDNALYSLKSQIAPENSVDIDSADFSSNFNLLDSNIKKTGDLVTLNYSEVEWENLSQGFATKKQQINPFGITNYNGFVKLTPSSDTWVRSITDGTGVITQTQSQWENSYIGNLLTSSNPNNKLRSRNVEFRAGGLQPSTQYYSFFGGNSTIDIVPKLLKVTMSSGVFQSGETISGYINGKKVSSFRLANANHKSGAYNNSTTTYAENPYSPSLNLNAYSSSSAVLNIDTYSLADDSDGRFYGYVTSGMILVGETSEAQSTVSNQTLITDSVGDLIGSFFIRNPLTNPAPPISFNTGSKSFKISSSSTNSSSSSVTFTEETFHSSGIVNSSVYNESIVIRRPPSGLPLNALRRDPLSQTFRTDNDGGFLTGIDLYFAEKDTTEKVFVEIRESDIGGKPKNKLVQNFARAEITSAGITTSSDGATATNVKFPSPLYLQPNRQYAVSVLCPSSDAHKLWIAESNQATVTTQSYPNAEQIVYSNQYTGGNLYKPQNGSVWNSSINEDLKFKFYKANFTSSSGSVYFHNPNISIGSTYKSKDSNIPSLTKNPVKVLPRKIKVGITTSPEVLPLNYILNEGSAIANKSSASNASFVRGTVEFLGGNIGDLEIINAGIGYSNGTFTVPLYNLNSSGENATGIVTVSGTKISQVSIANTGNAYRAGDLLGLSTSVMARGMHGTLSVRTAPTIDTIFLTDVQGQKFDKDDVIHVYNGSAWASIGGTIAREDSSTIDKLHEGNIFQIKQYDHGMQFDTNIVSIGGVHPTSNSVKLTSSIVPSNTTISVASTAGFDYFEGKKVAAANTGYAIVNDEIISYSAVNAGNLTILNRGVNQSVTRNHASDDLIYKYEMNGVSLTRINKSHNLPTDSALKNLRDIDSYHLEFDRSSGVEYANRSTNADMISFVDERDLGGSDVTASKNIQFNEIIPQFNTIVPEGTNVSSTLRTISGTSSNGSEVSFIDQGFESVSLNEPNTFNTPRIVASRINETNRITSLPRSKSLTLGVKMETNNSNVSPVIDLSEAATFVFNRNRLNKPITDYAKDSRSNVITGDPHSSVYVSNKINLSQSATSLKVLFNAYRHSSSDIRVLYKLYSSGSGEIDQVYQLFPGFDNLLDSDGDGIGDKRVTSVVNGGLPQYLISDGSSDIDVRPSLDNEFLEYQYSIDDLDQFSAFQIKIVMNGTNEAYSPRIKDLRAIALA